MPNTPQFVRAMAFAAGATAKGVKEIAKPLTHCIPLKDPSCFPKTDNKFESWGLFFHFGRGKGRGLIGERLRRVILQCNSAGYAGSLS